MDLESYFKNKNGIPLTLANLTILVVLSLLVLQGIGLLLGPWGEGIRLGPIFILLGAAMASATSIAIVKKLINNQEVTKKDIFAIVIITGLAIVMMFLLRDFVPEVFEGSFTQLQSLVGI